MSNAKKEDAFSSGLVGSGEDLPLLSPEPPSQDSSASHSHVSLEGEELAPQQFQQEYKAPDYNESAALFSEIRNFGETGESTDSNHSSTPAAAQNFSIAPNLVAAEGVQANGMIMSTAQMVPGFVLVQHLGLISAWCAFSPSNPDPIAEARMQLEKNAASLGANAILCIQIQPLENHPQPGLLLTGTAVVVKEA